MNSAFSSVCCDSYSRKTGGHQSYQVSIYIYYFQNKLTTFSAFSGFATAWAEVLCPAYVQGSKVLSLPKLLHYSSVIEHSLRLDLQHFTGDHPPPSYLVPDNRTFHFLPCQSHEHGFIPCKLNTIIPELYTYFRGQGGAFFGTKLLNHVLVMSVWCPGERDVKLHHNSLLGSYEFSSQHGAGPGLHQDLSEAFSLGSQLRHAICASSAWYQSKI